MLKSYQTIIDEVRSMGGEIVGLCSQTQKEADQAQETWNLDFPLIADPSCELVKMMNKKGWITSQVEAKVNDHEVVIRVFNDFTYQVAMLQPGVCALRGTDLNNMDVLCTWGSVPTAANIGGASGRPNPKQIVWKAIQKSLKGDYSNSKLAIVQETPLQGGWYFWGMLLANGNFIEPGGFGLDELGEGHNLPQKMARAARKLEIGIAGVGLVTAINPPVGIGGLLLYGTYLWNSGAIAALQDVWKAGL